MLEIRKWNETAFSAVWLVGYNESTNDSGEHALLSIILNIKQTSY